MKSILAVILAGIFLLPLSARSQSQQPLSLINAGKSAYRICLSPQADSNEVRAAAELSKYLFRISGARLPVVHLDAAAAARATKTIFIGSACPDYPASQQAAYNIDRKGTNLEIAGASSYQTLETVYVFLEQELGCQFLAPEAEIIPKKKSFRIDPHYHYSPAIRTRTVHAKLFYDHPAFAAKRRVTLEGFPDYVPEARVHTFNHFVPEKVYYKEHPEYFALVNGKRLPTQLCLSNDTVAQIILDSVTALFKRYPQASVLSVSQNDNTQYCQCDRCRAADEAAGSPAGSMLRLVNRVARAFPDKRISTLAYQYTRHAPHGIVPEKNVLVTLCSIECDRSAPIEEKSKDFAKDLADWSAIGAHLRIWDYTTQFTNFLAPFPNIHTLAPNIRFFADHHVNWVFEQHSHQPSDLYELRCWLTSQLLWNPSLSSDSLIRVFCQAYYGKAGSFVNSYVTELEKGIQEYPKFYLFLYGDPSQGFDSWLSADRMKRYNALFDQAQQAVAADPTYLHRVEIARIGIDFATLERYRLNEAPYTLNQSAAIQKRLARFTSATALESIVQMNEMGLPLKDYLAAYQHFLKNAAHPNLARGAKVVLKYAPTKYAHEDPQTLTDGAYGGWSFYANWLGFLKDLDAVVDLGSVKSFNHLSLSFLQVTNHVVFFPTSVDYEISEDGIHFQPVEQIPNCCPLVPTSKVNDIQVFQVKPHPMKARYIHVIGHNMGTPPYWHHAAGTGAWIFADELQVY